MGVEVSRHVRGLADRGEDALLQVNKASLAAERALTHLSDLTKGPKAVVMQTPSPTPTPAPIKYSECPPGLRLSGIIASSDGAYACLNDRMVKAGGVVNGAKVVAVRDFNVEMELDGERFIVPIGTGMPDKSSEPSEDSTADDEKPAAKPTSASKHADKTDSSNTSKKPKPSSKSKKSDPLGG